MDDPTPLLVLQVKFEFGRLKQSHGGISSARASPAELGLPKQQVSERTGKQQVPDFCTRRSLRRESELPRTLLRNLQPPF
ncbi:hypothetical protein FG05_13936 [Fusarium graminearum]|nr:hypothetical protein FG05_13936 [Fusarium graminearum]